jgi:hypothetical protein
MAGRDHSPLVFFIEKYSRSQALFLRPSRLAILYTCSHPPPCRPFSSYYPIFFHISFSLLPTIPSSPKNIPTIPFFILRFFNIMYCVYMWCDVSLEVRRTFPIFSTLYCSSADSPPRGGGLRFEPGTYFTVGRRANLFATPHPFIFVCLIL